MENTHESTCISIDHAHDCRKSGHIYSRGFRDTYYFITYVCSGIETTSTKTYVNIDKVCIHMSVSVNEACLGYQLRTHISASIRDFVHICIDT